MTQMRLKGFLFLGVFSALVSLAKAGLATCIDEHCPEGYFCHENNCQKCFKCDLLYRKGNFCVTDFNDCEECLEGYEEVLVTDLSNTIKPCKPVSKPVKKKVKLKICENDSSCPPNTYCNEESCVKCFNCSLLNRVPPVEKCAKELSDCGSCMRGFYEVAVTTEAKYKPCEKVTHYSHSISNSYSVFLFASLFSSLFLLAVPVFVFKKYRDRTHSKTIYERPMYPSAPPFYAIEMTESIKKAEGTQPINLGFIEEMKQQAKVFKEPDAPYYNRDEGVDQLHVRLIVDENDGSRLSSLHSSNSNQIEEVDGSSRVPETANDLGLDSTAEQPNENTVDNNESFSRNPDALEVIDIPQVPHESVEESNCLLETQNLQQRQT